MNKNATDSSHQIIKNTKSTHSNELCKEEDPPNLWSTNDLSTALIRDYESCKDKAVKPKFLTKSNTIDLILAKRKEKKAKRKIPLRREKRLTPLEDNLLERRYSRVKSTAKRAISGIHDSSFGFSMKTKRLQTVEMDQSDYSQIRMMFPGYTCTSDKLVSIRCRGIEDSFETEREEEALLKMGDGSNTESVDRAFDELLKFD